MAERVLRQILNGLTPTPEPKQLDPQKVMCVVKNKAGKELGKIPAACRSAEAYISELVRFHKSVHVDYVEDEEAVNLHRMIQHQLW